MKPPPLLTIVATAAALTLGLVGVTGVPVPLLAVGGLTVGFALGWTCGTTHERLHFEVRMARRDLEVLSELIEARLAALDVDDDTRADLQADYHRTQKLLRELDA